MFAVVKTGGKQYKVSAGDVIEVEKLDQAVGEKVTFTEVLMVVDGGKIEVGAPLLKGASVEAEVISQEKADTVIVFKKKRRQNYRRKNGHRQEITVLRVKAIKF